MKIGGRPEPVVVAKTWDDLWLGVICLTNPEIAGSPRNIFRYSGSYANLGVEHWMGYQAQARYLNQTPNTKERSELVSPARLSESGRAGKQPKLPIKAPKSWLSCKGC
jgi:hypothetical protein